MMEDDDSPDVEQMFENRSNTRLLDFESDLLAKTMSSSVLFVHASGLSVERLFLEHLILYSDRRLLALVLNTTPHDESYFISQLIEAKVDCQPKVINADVPVKDRMSVYLEGGVQFCSSRVVLVDLLQDRLPAENVAAIFVFRAHTALNAFQESFILRLYREKKKTGMVKAFTEQSASISSLGQLQRMIDRLYVKEVCLLPRFDPSVEEELSASKLRSAVFSVDVATQMRRVHRTLVELIKVCVKDLRMCSTANKSSEEQPLEELSHVPYHDTLLERRLRERKGFLSDKQTRLMQDIWTLRELLKLSESIDAATLLVKILSMRNDKQKVEEGSGWLFSPTVSRLVDDLQSLCGIGGLEKPTSSKFVSPQKWECLEMVIKEINSIPLKLSEVPQSGTKILLLVNSDEVGYQLQEVLKFGVKKAKWLCLKQIVQNCREDVPTNQPMWNPERIVLFMKKNLNQPAKSELIANVQKSQKETARAAQKRRKVAENLAVKDSTVQTSIVQFGILHYKKRRTKSPVKQEVEEVKEEEGEGTSESDVKTIEELANAEMEIMTHGDKYSMLNYLEKQQPTVIILYNMSLACLRMIEIYRACYPERYLQVYCLQYRDSAEESRYLETMERESSAFHSLIKEEENLLIAREYAVEREDPPRVKFPTRKTKKQDELAERPRIVVDMREFNSELPTVLYKKGYDVAAATLEVGDYVLTSFTSVERKALDDLAQSLQSGRVFKQAEQMLLHYANSVLLIESNTKFESRIVNGGPFQGELNRHSKGIRSMFCSLIRAQPRLKLLWSLSPANSAEYFAELKLNADEPDVETAVALRGDRSEEKKEEEETEKPKLKKKKKPNSIIQRAVTTHFGLKTSEAQRLLLSETVTNFSELFSASFERLDEVLPPSHVDFVSILSSYDFRK